ncbi:MAG: hypothetical protein JWN43_2800 [Gammaproteobacteria bacterium]|nr:hypothetical protein [Gammaproteobacteria bacterium]
MKGLLHRLAARAAGTTVAVRSDARLPFGGAGMGRAAEASEGQISVAEASHVHDSASLSPLTDRAPQDPQARRTDALMPDVQSALPTSATLAQPGELDTRLLMRLVAAAPADAETLAAVDLESMPVPTRGESKTRRDSRALHAPDPLRPIDALRLSDEPSLLMPTATPGKLQVHPDVSPATTHQPAMARAAANNQETEVHIHIGRIDVEAVHEAAPPRRTPPKTTSPMSLDSYLAKRGRT